jgi:hypothetical protein
MSPTTKEIEMEFDDLYGDWYDFFGNDQETTGETFTDDETPMFHDYYGGE